MSSKCIVKVIYHTHLQNLNGSLSIFKGPCLILHSVPTGSDEEYRGLGVFLLSILLSCMIYSNKVIMHYNCMKVKCS